jgi:UTP--glucose-1-phosphate uridylyltransferase
MLPIVDKPVIQYIVEELVASGIEEVIFVTGRGKRAIEDHFDPSFELEYLLEQKGKTEILEEVRSISNLAKFVYVRQAKPLGNGHAVLCAREVVGDEPFALCYGDDVIAGNMPAIKQMIEVYNKYGEAVLGTIKVEGENISRYGVVSPAGELSGDEKVFEVNGLVEKPAFEDAPSQYAAVARYILNPDIFDELENLEPGKSGEIWLTDALTRIFEKKKAYACNFEGTFYDCGNKLEYLKAVVHFGLQREGMKEGLTEYIKTKID